MSSEYNTDIYTKSKYDFQKLSKELRKRIRVLNYYDNEYGTTSSKMKNRYEAREIRLSRRLMRIYWTERVTYDKI